VKIRFQADENLDQAIVDGVLRREPAVEFQTAQESGLPGADDQEILQWCSTEDYVLVSHDVKTVPTHFAELSMRQRSPGAMLIPQKVSVGAAIESLVMIWNSYTASDWENRICYLPL
jgi:predicted nuclease of predicted toxin-antitoxin system